MAPVGAVLRAHGAVAPRGAGGIHRDLEADGSAVAASGVLGRRAGDGIHGLPPGGGVEPPRRKHAPLVRQRPVRYSRAPPEHLVHRAACSASLVIATMRSSSTRTTGSGNASHGKNALFSKPATVSQKRCSPCGDAPAMSTMRPPPRTWKSSQRSARPRSARAGGSPRRGRAARAGARAGTCGGGRSAALQARRERGRRDEDRAAPRAGAGHLDVRAVAVGERDVRSALHVVGEGLQPPVEDGEVGLAGARPEAHDALPERAAHAPDAAVARDDAGAHVRRAVDDGVEEHVVRRALRAAARPTRRAARGVSAALRRCTLASLRSRREVGAPKSARALPTKRSAALVEVREDGRVARGVRVGRRARARGRARASGG